MSKGDVNSFWVRVTSLRHLHEKDFIIKLPFAGVLQYWVAVTSRVFLSSCSEAQHWTWGGCETSVSSVHINPLLRAQESSLLSCSSSSWGIISYFWQHQWQISLPQQTNHKHRIFNVFAFFFLIVISESLTNPQINQVNMRFFIYEFDFVSRRIFLVPPFQVCHHFHKNVPV